MFRPAIFAVVLAAPLALAQPFQVEKLYGTGDEIVPGRFIAFFLVTPPAVDGDTVVSCEFTRDAPNTDWWGSVIEHDPGPAIVHENLFTDPEVGFAPLVANGGLRVHGYGPGTGSLSSLRSWDGVSAATVVQAGTARPGGGTFSSLMALELRGGRVLFFDRIPSGGSYVSDGVFLHDLGTGLTRRIAAVGDTVDGDVIDVIGIASLGDDGSVVVGGRNTAGQSVLYLVQPDGTADAIIRTGDPIHGSTFKNYTGQALFLGAGVLFGAGIDDGSGGTLRHVTLATGTGFDLVRPNAFWFQAARSSTDRVVAFMYEGASTSLVLLDLDGSTQTIIEDGAMFGGMELFQASLGLNSFDGSTVGFTASLDDPLGGFIYEIYRASLSAPCRADLTTPNAPVGDPNYGVPDGTVTVADIQYYVNAWVAGDVAIADMTTTNAPIGDPNYGVPDGAVTVADIQFYVNLWVAGCP